MMPASPSALMIERSPSDWDRKETTNPSLISFFGQPTNQPTNRQADAWGQTKGFHQPAEDWTREEKFRSGFPLACNNNCGLRAGKSGEPNKIRIVTQCAAVDWDERGRFMRKKFIFSKLPLAAVIALLKRCSRLPLFQRRKFIPYQQTAITLPS